MTILSCRWLFYTLFVAFGVYAYGQQYGFREYTTANDTTRALWVCGHTAAANSDEKADFFAFAVACNICTAYLESEWLVNHDQASLADFITDVDTINVSVELLFGYALWALTPNHAYPINLARSAVIFAQGLSGCKPAGLHFDVEPHILDEWDADMNGTANQYLDLLDSLASVTQGTGLRLTVDIPFWYDNRQVTRDGLTRPLSEWVLDLVDRATLMAYRDRADPPDGIIDHVASELTYAAAVSKEIVIGVESNCGLDPEKITFCEEGLAAMDSALYQTLQVYQNNPALKGFAVHDYDGYWDLCDFESYKKSIRTGWNMICGISEDVALVDVSDPEAIIIPGTLYGYNGAYFLSDTIKQGCGYWLAAGKSGQIILESK